jgi:hypothetical protein
MSGPYAGPGNDPFQGGSLQRLNPPSGGTGGFPPPNGGGGGSLAGNVAGGAPFFARNNRGSNVSIPYARVCPVPSTTTALPKSSESLGQFLNRDTRPTVEVIHETDELQKARLAWIMGRRGNGSAIDEFMVAIGNQFSDTEFGAISQGYGLDRQFNWDNGKGVNRHSRLCSTEYLGRIFEVAMRRVYIQLSLPYDDPAMGGKEVVGPDGKYGKRFMPNYKGGTLGTVTRPMKKEGNATLKLYDGEAANITDRFGMMLIHPDDEANLLGYAAAVGFDVTAANGGYMTQPSGGAINPARKQALKAALLAHVLQTRDQRTNAGQNGDAMSHPMQLPLMQTASMTLTNNITFDNGSRDMSEGLLVGRSPGFESAAVRSIDNRELIPNMNAAGVQIGMKLRSPLPDRNFKCGIYARPISPFLHGRTLLTGMSATVLESDKQYPRRMPDALGDHVAFTALEQAMTRVGLLDWRPDGVVNSKLENGPDKMVRPSRILSTASLAAHLLLSRACAGRRRVRHEGRHALQRARPGPGHLQQLVRHRALAQCRRWRQALCRHRR